MYKAFKIYLFLQYFFQVHIFPPQFGVQFETQVRVTSLNLEEAGARKTWRKKGAGP